MLWEAMAARRAGVVAQSGGRVEGAPLSSSSEGIEGKSGTVVLVQWHLVLFWCAMILGMLSRTRTRCHPECLPRDHGWSIKGSMILGDRCDTLSHQQCIRQLVLINWWQSRLGWLRRWCGGGGDCRSLYLFHQFPSLVNCSVVAFLQPSSLQLLFLSHPF